jgi:cardiolipin synthase A/B
MDDPVLLILLASFTINMLFAVFIVFFEQREPTATLAWLLILFLVPPAGFVLFVVFGLNHFRRRKFARDAAEGEDELRRQGLFEHESLSDEVRNRQSCPVVTLLLAYRAILTEKNTVEVFTEGSGFFDALFADIAAARQYIHIEFFMIGNDETGRRFVAALTEKAREDVEVRLLYDVVGSILLPGDFFDSLTAAGGRVVPFYSSFLFLMPFRINYRNHRKVAIIDGNTGYVGGFNVGNEYLGKGPLGPWRDTHLRIGGDAVRFLQARFYLDWRHASGEGFKISDRYFPREEAEGATSIQIASSGPDTVPSEIKEAFVKMIHSARRFVYIQTPYFIPDRSVTDALRIAAQSGVDVRLMIPTKPDHPFIYWATHSYIGGLLEGGVKVYTYENGFLHAKTIVADGEVASVGSANWDMRSFELNFETNAFLYGKEFAGTLTRIFEEDIARSTEVTPERYAGRSAVIRIKESVSRLLSPIL